MADKAADFHEVGIPHDCQFKSWLLCFRSSSLHGLHNVTEDNQGVWTPAIHVGGLEEALDPNLIKP